AGAFRRKIGTYRKAYAEPGEMGGAKAPIVLGSLVFNDPRDFALAVACRENWSQGLEVLKQGTISLWIEVQEGGADRLNLLKRIAEEGKLEDDVRLMLTLKVLNPDMPLVYGGEIVTPLWLLDNPEKGYALMGSVAPFLDGLGEQGWFLRLHKRVKHIRKRAASLHIRLDESKLQEYLLYTSHAQLAAHAHQHYLVYPDARSAGVLSLMERRDPTVEDLIVLLCADVSQLVSAKEVLQEVEAQAQECHLHFDPELAQDYIRQPSVELYKMLDERAEGMAVTGHAHIDGWVEQYRLEKRMPIVRLLVLLLYPKEQWLLPQKHQYMTSLLDFFEKKVAFSGLIGPLVRMRIGRHTPRFDVTELKRANVKVNELLGHVLSRKKTITSFSFSPNDWDAYSRIDALTRDADLYKRDTGIDGLYMGFPFLLYQEPRSHRLPRIAPVFLWPMSLQKELGGNWSTSLAFDSTREEVRLNPALENILGKATAQKWGEILEELMRRSTLSVSDVMERFAEVGKVASVDEPMALPVEFEVPEGEVHVVPSAVLFMVNFTGQAVGEDLRALKGLPLAGSSLEKLLRLGDEAVAEVLTTLPPENERYLVGHSDPSQESAVFRARESAGLLIEGPPGTGKSQTIVNLVADSIGRSENMLIVCQKKAALDVVHKRLVAEGLGSRIMMINDVNADRDATIRSVREQLAQLGAQLWEMKSSAQNLQWERQKLGERITELERELDQYHEGLHTVDAQTGATYRQVISDLVRLEAETLALSLPTTRPLVGGLTQNALSALEKEVCAVLPLWLAAHDEGSPFEHLRLFPNDVAAAGVFKRALQIFNGAGDEVEQARKVKPVAVHVKSDPRAFREWLQTHMDMFVTLSGEPKQQLMRWLPLFQTLLPAQSVNLIMRSVGGDLLEKFRHLLGALKEVPIAHWQDSYSVMAASLDDATLQTLEKQASVLATPRPWYAFLTFWRGGYEKNVAQVLQAHGCEATELKDYVVLTDALTLERQLRPLRRELLHICETLKLPVPEQDSGPELMTYAQYCFNALLQVAEWADLIGAFPDVPTLTGIIRSGDGEALQRLRMDYELAFMHYALRQKWLKTLEELAPFFSDYLLEECRYAIGQGMDLPATVARMTEELPRLSAYLAFRDQWVKLSPEGKELLSRLQDERDALEAVPEARLSVEFGRA
ncbi:MAG: AAA domain-containing protein, partial [Saezia sp.]